MKNLLTLLALMLVIKSMYAQWNPQTSDWSKNSNPVIGDWGFNRPGYPSGLYIQGLTIKTGEKISNPVIYDNDVVNDVLDDEWAFVMADLGLMNLAGYICTPTLTDGSWKFYHPDWKDEFYQMRTRALNSGMCPARIPQVTIGTEANTEGEATCKSSAGAQLYVNIINQQYNSDPSRPVIINIGGQSSTLASAYCIDNSIAKKCIVYYTDITEYNGVHEWASELVAKNFRVINFGRKHTWWQDKSCQDEWEVLPRPTGCGRPNKNTRNSGEWAQIPSNPIMDFFISELQNMPWYDATNCNDGHNWGCTSDGYFDGTFIHAWAPGFITGVNLESARGGMVLYITNWAKPPVKTVTFPPLTNTQAFDGKCPDVSSILITPSNPSICLGKSTAITVSGANTYTWSPATGLNTTTGASVIASPAATTTYTVTGKDAGGQTKTGSVTVTVNTVPATPSITKTNCDALLSSASGTNQWYLNGTPIPGATGQTLLPVQSGVYTVEADNGGCRSAQSQGYAYTFVPFAEKSCSVYSLPITIDGKPDEPAWNVNARSICKTILGSEGNVTASFKTRWDNLNLYMAAEVNDPQLSNSSVNIWENSAVEFFLDMNNAKTPAYETNDFQYIIGWNNTVLFERTNRTTGVQFKTANKTGGYTAEVSIPWTTLGVTPANGTTYGFDIGIDISHTAGTRTGALVWSGDANNFQNTSKFGEIKLDNNCQVTSADEKTIVQKLKIYPNPVSNFIMVESTIRNEEMKLSILDMQGRIVVEKDIILSEGKYTLNLEQQNLTPGIYLLRATTHEHNYQFIKLILRKQ